MCPRSEGAFDAKADWRDWLDGRATERRKAIGALRPFLLHFLRLGYENPQARVGSLDWPQWRRSRNRKKPARGPAGIFPSNFLFSNWPGMLAGGKKSDQTRGALNYERAHMARLTNCHARRTDGQSKPRVTSRSAYDRGDGGEPALRPAFQGEKNTMNSFRLYLGMLVIAFFRWSSRVARFRRPDRVQGFASARIIPISAPISL